MENQPIKILHIIDTLEMGGAQEIIYKLATMVDQKRFKTLVCSWNNAGAYQQKLEQAGIEAIAFNINRRSMLILPLFVIDMFRIITRLFSIIKSNQINLIHAHLPDSWMLAVFLGRVCGIPMVITVHNNSFMPIRSKARCRDFLRKWIVKITLRLSSKVITVGEDVRKSLLQKIANNISATTIYNGIDCDRFAEPYNIEKIKSSLGLKPESKIILCAARLVPQKGHKYLIKAAAEFTSKHPEANILIAGEGPCREELGKQVRNADLSERIFFLGRISDMPELLAASDIFVLPSFYEGMPVVILEAMAAQKAIVATDIPGTRELITDKQQGLLTPVKDHLALAKNIESLLNNPDLAKALSQKAGQKAREQFTIEKMITATENIYQTVSTKL